MNKPGIQMQSKGQRTIRHPNPSLPNASCGIKKAVILVAKAAEKRTPPPSHLIPRKEERQGKEREGKKKDRRRVVPPPDIVHRSQCIPEYRFRLRTRTPHPTK